MGARSKRTVYHRPQSVVDPLRAFVGAGTAVMMLVGFCTVAVPVMSVVWLR